jgi:hypothetical protein
MAIQGTVTATGRGTTDVLLTNGGFETDSLDSWDVSYYDSPLNDVTVSASYGHTGYGCSMYSETSGGTMGTGVSWIGISQSTVDLSNSTLLKLDYRVTQYATDDISQGNIGAVFINYTFDEEASEEYGFQFSISATADWITKYVSVPATCMVSNATVSIMLSCVYGV